MVWEVAQPLAGEMQLACETPMPLRTAADLVRPGECALVLFTRGSKFTQVGKKGETGNWVIDPARKVDWVIIYHRDGKNADGGAVWRGRPDGIIRAMPPSARHPGGKARYCVSLVGLKFLGRVRESWRIFADSWSNPIRYIER